VILGVYIYILFELNFVVIVNGFLCKDVMVVIVEDFLLRGLDKVGDMSNMLGFVVILVFVM